MNMSIKHIIFLKKQFVLNVLIELKIDKKLIIDIYLRFQIVYFIMYSLMLDIIKRFLESLRFF